MSFTGFFGAQLKWDGVLPDTLVLIPGLDAMPVAGSISDVHDVTAHSNLVDEGGRQTFIPDELITGEQLTYTGFYDAANAQHVRLQDEASNHSIPNPAFELETRDGETQVFRAIVMQFKKDDQITTGPAKFNFILQISGAVT